MNHLKSHKEQILKGSFVASHVGYFVGVASGIHEISAFGAGVILFVMALSYAFHIHLEG